jgi:hypothetical protein
VLSIEDINGDGLLQLAELTLNTDMIVLATPEIAGLPYVISGLVAAGGLAAALSTADGLLLTIANAMSHDVYYKIIDPNASTQRRLVISKALLLVVALVAAYTASLKPDNILFMVGLAFSIAASAFFPALVCGVFWKRATGVAASLGMVAGGRPDVLLHGLEPAVAAGVFFGIPKSAPITSLWWDIQPISARPVRRAAGVRGDHPGEHAPAVAGHAEPGRARPVSEPEARQGLTRLNTVNPGAPHHAGPFFHSSRCAMTDRPSSHLMQQQLQQWRQHAPFDAHGRGAASPTRGGRRAGLFRAWRDHPATRRRASAAALRRQVGAGQRAPRPGRPGGGRAGLAVRERRLLPDGRADETSARHGHLRGRGRRFPLVHSRRGGARGGAGSARRWRRP